MLKTILIAFTLLFGSNSPSTNRVKPASQEPETGTLEKMIVASGSATMDLNLSRLHGSARESRATSLRFDLEHDAFFTILVFNNELRGPIPGSIKLTPQNSAALPATLSASFHQLVIESTPWGGDYDLVVRDVKSGFVFFNIEGHSYDYDAGNHLLNIQNGRVLMSKAFAEALGRPAEAGSVVGKISVAATMRAIEITRVVNGEAVSAVQPSVGTIPGPDVIVGDLNGLAQFGSSSGTQVGLAVGTDSCNMGAVDLDWFALPDNNHPVIPQNLYRMSGGATNDERFEQIGESNVKHAFTALTQNICGLGCNGVGSTHLGSGCSDPYVASLNSGGTSGCSGGGTGNCLGSRAWINPFTGAYPRGDSATPPNIHSGHTHTGPSHRIIVEINDLNTTLNPGASYYAESQYVTPHEYVWCQAHAGQCNMYNNVSYRRYNVTGTASPFSFPTGGFSTVRMKAAVNAWTGATIVQIEPAPGTDGIGFVAYKVTNPSAGVWHYEYAVYNQNMDRGIQSVSIPLGAGINLSNVGFHAPPQQPGWTGDGTVGNTGYSSTPWTPVQTGSAITWSSETFAQNQNANAVRWGNLYNYRFDSDQPPQTVNAAIGFYKTGSPINVQVQGPTPNVAVLPTVQFSSATYNAGEGSGSATITVTRAGDTSSTSTVDFASSDGTALQSQDYTVASGTLNFAAGDVSKTFTVLLVDDVFVESDEIVNLTLSNPTGSTLGAQATAALTINDNDAGGPSITSKRFFAQLSGNQETPSNGSTAIGSGLVLLNSADTSAMTGLKFDGLGTNESAAHIHTGGVGVAGPVTFPLPTQASTQYTFSDMSISPTSQQVSDLRGGLQYMNVHSANFPNGEIRGQLLWNPTLENAFLVRQHYLDFLNREPDAGGLNFWIGEIHCPQGSTADQADVVCYQARTIAVSDSFFFSPEFHQTAAYVFLAYRASYGNTQPSPVVDPVNQTEANKLPSYAGFTSDRARVLGGASLAVQQHAFANLFVSRPEFIARYPTATFPDGTTFVNGILNTITTADPGVAFSGPTTTALVTQYNNAGGGTAGRAQVLFCLALDDAANNPISSGNSAFINAEYNRQFALTLYYGYMRRNPDITGFLFWQSQINLAPVGDVPKQNALVCSFLTSSEYQGRFGASSPRTNDECPH